MGLSGLQKVVSGASIAMGVGLGVSAFHEHGDAADARTSQNVHTATAVNQKSHYDELFAAGLLTEGAAAFLTHGESLRSGSKSRILDKVGFAASMVGMIGGFATNVQDAKHADATIKQQRSALDVARHHRRTSYDH